MTKYEEQMYNDIHRIANALEHISKWITQIDLNREEQMTGLKFLQQEVTSTGTKFVITDNIKAKG